MREKIFQELSEDEMQDVQVILSHLLYPLSEKPEQAKPQGTLLDMRVKESGKSECRSVMHRIRIEILSGPKGSRLPGGARLRESLKKLIKGESK